MKFTVGTFPIFLQLDSTEIYNYKKKTKVAKFVLKYYNTTVG